MYAVHSIDDESEWWWYFSQASRSLLDGHDAPGIEMFELWLLFIFENFIKWSWSSPGGEIDPKSSTHNESFLAREHFQFDSETVRIPWL